MYNIQEDRNDRHGEGLVLVLERLTESRAIAPPENSKFHEVKYESARLCEQVALVQT